MFLERLVVSHSGKIIRDIAFKKGLNLIVDETRDAKNTTGNNVGKSTMIRVIDYCLGGKLDRIYIDKESKSANEKVKEFLEDSSTEITLELAAVNAKHIITRKFGEKPVLDGDELSASEFEEKLGYLLFRLKSNKPSLRQLLGKFIRLETYQLDNIYKFLFPMAGSKETYESIYLHLFGFLDHDLLKRKDNINRLIKKANVRRLALSTFKKGAIRQMVRAFDKDIKELEVKLENFQISDSFKNDATALEGIRDEISDLSIELSNLSTRISLSEQTLASLSESKSNIDIDAIEEMYNQATAFLGSVKKSFEETVTFHNSMVDNKISFVQKSIDTLNAKKIKIAEQLESISEKESEFLKKMSKKGALEDLQNFNTQLLSLKEERAKKQGIYEEIENTEKELSQLNNALSEVNSQIKHYQEKLDESLDKFNDYYRGISKELYNEEYIFSYEINDDDVFEFTATTMVGAVGAGKKKGQIAAFDLAYLKYLEKKQSSMCRFQVHDRLEEIHLNQLKAMFDIANGINGQFVVPILRERIAGLGDQFIKDNMVVSLADDDKFFRI